LEIKILNAFCEFLYKRLKKHLLSTKIVKITEKSDKNLNLLFLLSQNKEETSKIYISIPIDRIDFKSLKKKISFKDENFLSCQTNVKIRAGKTKITLDELKNLMPEDIILLEESNSSSLTLISGKTQQQFGVVKDSSLILDIEEEEENEIKNEVKMEKNLWDDIQIEISAEFDKVKMSIGELKQITQGQIVDLGSVFNNEISLYVEDKQVAKGDLLIINDRYAVRLNEILNSSNVSQTIKTQNNAQQSKQQEQTKPTPPPPPAPKPQAKVKEEAVDEEFDYSDFEN